MNSQKMAKYWTMVNSRKMTNYPAKVANYWTMENYPAIVAKYPAIAAANYRTQTIVVENKRTSVERIRKISPTRSLHEKVRIFKYLVYETISVVADTYELEIFWPKPLFLPPYHFSHHISSLFADTGH